MLQSQQESLKEQFTATRINATNLFVPSRINTFHSSCCCSAGGMRQASSRRMRSQGTAASSYLETSADLEVFLRRQRPA